ncbi:MAG: hypothetical protein NZ828_01400 [Alphaproteobacteria bacterium]|nr:hypothetical protein [Alphaproteobacteria bacterium]
MPAQNNNVINTTLNETFGAEGDALTCFFNESVEYGLSLLLVAAQDGGISLNADQTAYIKTEMMDACPNLKERFVRAIQERNVKTVAEFDALYQYDVFFGLDREQTILKDLVPNAYDEQAATIQQLTLESLYQVAKAKVI